MATPSSFGVCYEQGLHCGKLIIFDSHSHGEYGSLVAIVSSDQIIRVYEILFQEVVPIHNVFFWKREGCKYVISDCLYIAA